MCKDLVVNIRNQVVKRQEHTHNYVYKLRGLLAKAPGWTYVQRWNLSRGFSTRFTRHKIWIYSLLDLAGGFLQKHLSSSSVQTGQGTGDLRRSWWPAEPVLRRPRYSGDLGLLASCARGRGEDGNHMELLTHDGDR
jgi:hypothetical protein